MSQTQTHRETLASALLAMAYADKEVLPSEVKALEKCLQRLECTVEDIRDSSIIEDDFADIKETIPEGSRREFLTDLLRVAYADLELSPEELELAVKVARMLDISPAELEQIRAGVFKEHS